jgi:hypothetical protein
VARYDVIFSTLAERAVAQGIVDIESLVTQLSASGVPQNRIADLLLEDFEEGGPVFGRFRRTLAGAASSATMAAVRQGEAIGYLDGTRAGRELANLANVRGSVIEAIDNTDPELADRLEQDIIGEVRHMWIAELVNTCYRCLPLHGTSLTLNEWRDRGLHPDSIHADWTSSCHCRLVPMHQAGSRGEEMAPLKRTKIPKELRGTGFRKTQRSVTQKDLTSSLAARDKALERDPEGNLKNPEAARTIRVLGQARKEE